MSEEKSARLLWLGVRRTSKHFRGACPVLGCTNLGNMVPIADVAGVVRYRQ